MNEMNIGEISKLAKMKREHPKKYKQYLKDLEDVSKDMIGIIKKLESEFKKPSEDIIGAKWK